MKLRNLCLAAITAAALWMPPGANAAAPDKTVAAPSAACTTDKSNRPTCTRKSDTPLTSAPGHRPKECTFVCKQSNGIWVCRGSGPECNGQSPWN